MKRGAINYESLNNQKERSVIVKNLTIEEMKEESFFDDGTKGLVAAMEKLSEVNRQIAVSFDKIYGDGKEIEDDIEYKEAQSFIRMAIHKIGQIVGNNISQHFI